MSHSVKVVLPSPKLMESTMKAVKVEIVRRANEEAVRKEAEAEVEVSEPTEKAQKEKTLEKSRRLLAEQDEMIARVVMEILPPKVRAIIDNF